MVKQANETQERLSEYSKEKRRQKKELLDKIQGLFLKGPISEEVLKEVAALDKKGGKCMVVVILLLIFNGMNKNNFQPFYIPSKCLEDWEITRQAYNRAIDRLAGAGLLIIVDRGKGWKTRIKLIRDRWMLKKSNGQEVEKWK